MDVLLETEVGDLLVVSPTPSPQKLSLKLANPLSPQISG